MAHDHADIAVDGSATTGVEKVSAHQLEEGIWLLLRSPLYAMGLAAGDTIRILDHEVDAFEVVARGGNVAAQFYLAEWGDPRVTAEAASSITSMVVAAGGRLDVHTTGPMVYTIPIETGFPAIEQIFAEAVDAFPGAQWQYANVYDLIAGEPLNWWE
ncbi:DUF4265 domain-containing protein [Massilia sp. G4R7]|uniref:DUF4265 domain-containing protein n=1 Tax=Massilia phyllostachyos TaxID=2898585 RepID=A0ABS8Q1J4_9BURK|nr:DUF4265 domain-containing protein [Massilia phyllostachyos]MCD2515607.1 DUF4265 domain-containing protein [Massilia phyllostachyos]